MLYVNNDSFERIVPSFGALVAMIVDATKCIDVGDYAQPIKPYLRYGNPKNRIIAMPAFVGGAFDTAGIKWIASFPGNLERGLPRAHSVVILNEAETGVPVAIVDTPQLSVVRTAAVSGAVIDRYLRLRRSDAITLGITGWGPIGRRHHAMAAELLGPRLRRTRVFDTRPEAAAGPLPPGVEIARTWAEAYDDADIFITCTVSDARYIDRPPKPGSLQLNVSLRDYTPAVFDAVRGGIVVDDWTEVCRENTDIELFHRQCGLEREATMSIADVLVRDALARVSDEQPIMFNPMGMAVFDVALATVCVRRAREAGIGLELR